MKKTPFAISIAFLTICLGALFYVMLDDQGVASAGDRISNRYVREVVAEGTSERSLSNALQSVTVEAFAYVPKRNSAAPEIVEVSDNSSEAEDLIAERHHDYAVDEIIARVNDGKGLDAVAITNYMAKFNALSDDQKNIEIHHLLNYTPDEGVPLLSAILFDTTQPKSVLDATYDDLLNRNWDLVKIPMLRRLAMDKSHPLHSAAVEALDAIE